MSQRRLRDELRDVFDSLSEPAHPALASRIRREIDERRAAPRPVPRLAVAAAVLVAGAVVASLLLAGHAFVRPPATPAGTVPSPTPIAQATPTPASTRAAVLPGFSCAAQSGGAGTAGLTGVRAAAQTGYDRFVIQFAGPVAPYQVVPQASATFTTDPRGSPAPLAGTAGLKVTVSGVSNWTSLPGPTDVRPTGTQELVEARQVGAFEGVVTWGLGLARPACFRAYTLTGPNRLVIDVQA
jgi:hypothetical protein